MLYIHFREDTLARIRRLEPEINETTREMNNIIRENNLPEDLIKEPFPDEEDEECE